MSKMHKKKQILG